MMRALPSAAIVIFAVACGAPKPPPAESPPPASESERPPESQPTSSPAATQPTPTSTATACTKSSECVITTFNGCCACCPGVPKAVFAPELERLERKCDAVRCPQCSTDCGAAVDVTSYLARCEQGKCVTIAQ